MPFGLRLGVELLFCHQFVPPVELGVALAEGVVLVEVVVVEEGVVVVVVAEVVVPELPVVVWACVCGGALTVAPVP